MKNFLLVGVGLFVLLTPIVANAKIFKCIDNKVDNINSKRIIEIKDYWFFATLKDLTNTSNPIKFKIEKFTKYHITAIGKEDMGGVFRVRLYNFDRINFKLVENFNIEPRADTKRKDDITEFNCELIN